MKARLLGEKEISNLHGILHHAKTFPLIYHHVFEIILVHNIMCTHLD